MSACFNSQKDDWLRSDAKIRREALLTAAARVFARMGFEAPLEEIAREAGVGRGTLYRNFADRFALAEALLEQEVDRLQAAAEQLTAEPGDFFVLITELASGLRRTAMLVEGLRHHHPAGQSDLRRYRRVEQMFAGPMLRAQAGGRLRADLAPHDVLLLASMLRGGVAPIGEPDDLLDRSLDLLIAGLKPAPSLRSG